MRANSGMMNGLNPTITILSKIFVVAFVMFCMLQAETAGKIFESISTLLLNDVKWFYTGSMMFIVGLLIYLMVSRFGLICLGKDDQKPEFSFIAWISMLFSGGMGVGLVFWSAAELMLHYANNPFTPGFTDQAASMSMQLAFFHWGLHPWSIFCITALALAYFSYRKDLPFSLFSILYPLIGNKIYGPIGHTIDILILTSVITAFGIAQSLGMGVIQINSGLSQAFGMANTLPIQIALISILCSIATVSVVFGITKGMQKLSELNMLLSLGLIIIFVMIGPTRYILHTFLETIGNYTQNIVAMSFWNDAQKDSGWQNPWTAYYWSWWMIWAPFVGMFVARISKGRTIWELVAGVLLVPTFITAIWLSMVGGTALKVEQNYRHAYEKQMVIHDNVNDRHSKFEGGPILKATKTDTTQALFTTFESVDEGFVGKSLNIIACLLLATYFVTSADCGTHVLCYLDTGGLLHTPTDIRILWGVLIAGMGTALLYAGGL